MTAAKLIEIAEERNRNTGMRWAAAARPIRIASISGSTRSKLTVRSDCASAAAPSAATKRTYVFMSCVRSIASSLVDQVPGRAGPRLRTRGLLIGGLPCDRLPGHALPGDSLPREALPRHVLPRDGVPANVLPRHAFPRRAARVHAAVEHEVTPDELLALDEPPHVFRERVAHAARSVLFLEAHGRRRAVRVDQPRAAVVRGAESKWRDAGLETLLHLRRREARAALEHERDRPGDHWCGHRCPRQPVVVRRWRTQDRHLAIREECIELAARRTKADHLAARGDEVRLRQILERCATAR